MTPRLKFLIATLMMLALMFGFLDRISLDGGFSFERLHIFLFNLCSGGTILIFYTENKKRLSPKGILFLTLSLTYACLSFFHIYIPAIIVSLILTGIVESVRWNRFSFIPTFFSKEVTVSKKFHQASLLCLSMGLCISSCVILNNEYLKIISMPKLQLDTFFLGFSFPLSLISMSAIFSLMEKDIAPVTKALEETGFWIINLGVIIFFLFIIFEKLVPQLFVTLVLFACVIMILVLYYKTGRNIQQKNFLTSGIGFLLVSAVTGILYIILEFSADYSMEKYHWLIRLHSFASLYGWNLCGLAVICRFDDFPIRLNSGFVIFIHWLTVIVLAPLGITNTAFDIMALAAYGFILYAMLFSRKNISAAS